MTRESVPVSLPHEHSVCHRSLSSKRHFPYRSPSEFLGLEGEGRLPLDPAALRQAYLDVLNEHLVAVRETTRRFGFDYLKVDTSKPLGPVLSHFLARRAALVDKRR